MLVKIAKRENNNKRKYLVVNPIQAKHIPVSPSSSIQMFNALADKIAECYNPNKLLLVGFAETATAIGAGVAVKLGSYYMQTTREIVENAEYMFFTESHSHATEQKLVKNDIDQVISDIDRIIFVEDEVTTGNTIMKIVNIIRKNYGDKVQFSVASLLNGMNSESLEIYHKNNIDVHYLVKTEHSTFTQIAESYLGNGSYIEKDCSKPQLEFKRHEVKGLVNTRRLSDSKKYLSAVNELWKNICNITDFSTSKSILVIGTEECMYPAIFVGSMLEKSGKKVLCHSTTRSPIAVSLEEDYPVHTRYSLASLYDKNRNTFIYDLAKYDKVIVITDSKLNENEGINTLVNALEKQKNTDVEIIRWC